MSDRRIVQCFGIKKRPHKQDKICRKRFLWTAVGSTMSHFGGRGTQACPYCGTLPDFQHPLNKYLNGDLTQAEAEAEMPGYLEILKSRR